jgi:hypothetical protein
MTIFATLWILFITVVICGIIALIGGSASGTIEADKAVNKAKSHALATCESGGAAEDVQGDNRIFYACGDGRYGYVNYEYNTDWWPLWD